MWKYEAERLCIEEVEKLTPAQAHDYLVALHPSYTGKVSEVLSEGCFPDGFMPGLLESIALEVIVKAQKEPSGCDPLYGQRMDSADMGEN